jgi:hypothetical protein
MKLLCRIGLHWWKTKKEKVEVVGHSKGRKHVRVNIRECRFCGDRQYYSLPDKNDNRVWKRCDFKKNDKIILEQIK